MTEVAERVMRTILEISQILLGYQKHKSDIKEAIILGENYNWS